MKKVNVGLGEKGYEIRIGPGILSQVPAWLGENGFSGLVVVITDERVSGIYGDRLTRLLEDGGFGVQMLTVPEGEAHKSLKTAEKLYTGMSLASAERGTPVLALGGGVIGDLVGFVAATYQRGVPLLQLPTTLLAQVDSSVGGKVGLDLGPLKNMVGAFYQPRAVFSDVSLLESLPGGEFTNGLAEVIKSAAIRDAGFFAFLEENLDSILARDERLLAETVFRTATIKAEVVSQDEKDYGLRNILNYGHTIGHGLEAASGFALKHGAAVGAGMVAAAEIACRAGSLERAEADRLGELIRRAGLPAVVRGYDTEEVIRAMCHDKKIAGGRLRFVLLKSLGESYVTEDVDLALVREVLGDG